MSVISIGIEIVLARSGSLVVFEGGPEIRQCGALSGAAALEPGAAGAAVGGQIASTHAGRISVQRPNIMIKYIGIHHIFRYPRVKIK